MLSESFQKETLKKRVHGWDVKAGIHFAMGSAPAPPISMLECASAPEIKHLQNNKLRPQRKQRQQLWAYFAFTPSAWCQATCPNIEMGGAGADSISKWIPAFTSQPWTLF